MIQSFLAWFVACVLLVAGNWIITRPHALSHVGFVNLTTNRWKTILRMLSDGWVGANQLNDISRLLRAFLTLTMKQPALLCLRIQPQHCPAEIAAHHRHSFERRCWSIEPSHPACQWPQLLACCAATTRSCQRWERLSLYQMHTSFIPTLHLEKLQRVNRRSCGLSSNCRCTSATFRRPMIWTLAGMAPGIALHKILLRHGCWKPARAVQDHLHLRSRIKMMRLQLMTKRARRRMMRRRF